MKKSSYVAGLARTLVMVLCLWGGGPSHAQAPAGATMITETSPGSDTIGERAKWSLEEQRRKNGASPVPNAAAIGVISTNSPKAGAAPDFAVTGIRGFVGSLEASFLINGKRASGSTRYPTLVESWKVVEITSAGAVIEKNRERKQLSFSGSSPYQEKTAVVAEQQPANGFLQPRNPMQIPGMQFTPPMNFPGSGGPGAVPAVPMVPGIDTPSATR
jgi:hypothetical protein